jgi:gliding motility-associated lipoprotein GldJ
MDETEVTNFMYLEYLDWLKMYSTHWMIIIDIFMKVLRIPLVWRNRLGYNETMTNNYLDICLCKLPCRWCKLIQAVEFSKWRTDRKWSYFRKNGYLKKNAKTNDVTAESSFTETYLKAPTMTYGGNEEIVSRS